MLLATMCIDSWVVDMRATHALGTNTGPLRQTRGVSGGGGGGAHAVMHPSREVTEFHEADEKYTRVSSRLRTPKYHFQRQALVVAVAAPFRKQI